MLAGLNVKLIRTITYKSLSSTLLMSDCSFLVVMTYPPFSVIQRPASLLVTLCSYHASSDNDEHALWILEVNPIVVLLSSGSLEDNVFSTVSPWNASYHSTWVPGQHLSSTHQCGTISVFVLGNTPLASSTLTSGNLEVGYITAWVASHFSHCAFCSIKCLASCGTEDCKFPTCPSCDFVCISWERTLSNDALLQSFFQWFRTMDQLMIQDET